MLSMRDISKEFPGVMALKGAGFCLKAGQIKALVGANGAGKSTLMKILSGAYGGYGGEILLDGKPVVIGSPKAARDVGIQMVYQEVDTALIPYLTVAENLAVDGLASSHKKLLNWGRLYENASKMLVPLGIELPLKDLAGDLSLAQKQLLLIARALHGDCRILILDEPTAPLSQHETDRLFEVVSQAAKKGVGIVFISHRMPEIFSICHEITVMRNGTFVGNYLTEATSPDQVVEAMLGQKLQNQFPKFEKSVGEALLQTKNFGDGGLVKDFSLTVRAGEIVGISGLVGAGKTEFCKALFGAAPSKGEILLKGKPVSIKNPYDACRQGFALVPEERRQEGIHVLESVLLNLTAPTMPNRSNALGFLAKERENGVALALIEKLGIKAAAPHVAAGTLSGGNQQKVAIGKWLGTNADVFIFDEPTKGVDVGAKKDIFALMGALAAAGKGIIYATCEFSELLGLTDRIYVAYDGRLVQEFEASETSEHELLFYSAGGGSYGG
ncbi:MAG: sugar ABC transporter ATP-binding protein [Turicibacter sp.]|nr:sugar ABC transporter ATP-binding protein [Turicibacter sp.]